MATKDPRVDTYIANAAPFAQPILRHMRALVHTSSVQIDETIKWGFPHFDYKGGIFCSMAAFKHHCAFSFWLGALLEIEPSDAKAMGQFGRIASLTDLPNDREIRRLLKRAMALHESGAKPPSRAKDRPAKPAPETPIEMLAALKKNRAAFATFDGFSPSNQREYIEWYVEAKTEVTRQKRLAQAIEWLAEGKIKNWKYVK